MKFNNQSKSQKNPKSHLYFKLLFIVCSVLLCTSQSSFAQKERATIYGKTIEIGSADTLIGCNISIYKNDKKVGTIVSDIDGKFYANLLPGLYDFEAAFTGYKSDFKRGTNVIDGDSLELNFSLETNGNFTIGSSPISAMEVPKQSDPILNAEVSVTGNGLIKGQSIIITTITEDISNYTPPKKKELRISPAKYEVYRNKEEKSPFRYPVAKIPIVTKNNALSALKGKISMGKLPKDQEEIKEIAIEELFNSLDYNYPSPKSNNKPFEIYTELFTCPWNDEKRLLHIGIQAIKLDSVFALTEPNIPMAEDVDINIEFNPAYVMDYRLVGYEDYLPNLLSYRIDPKMNSTMLTGQSLTAIYEYTPTQNKFVNENQILLYQKRPKSLEKNNELGTVQIFYRAPSARKSWKVKHRINRFVKSDIDIEEKTFLAVSIAELAMRLKESPYLKTGNNSDTLNRLRSIEKLSEKGYEILELAEKIQLLESKSSEN
ncbi:MAG: hypothetical protein ACJA1A_002319 [Saprospiraceae bacterium]|jgi:hypothetical protein